MTSGMFVAPEERGLEPLGSIVARSLGSIGRGPTPARAAPSRCGRRTGDSLIVLMDDREKRPFVFPPHVHVERRRLAVGDYSLPSGEDRIAIERKGVDDLVSCVAGARARFWRELERLAALECQAIIVEGTMSDIATGRYRPRVHPSAALGSVVAIVADFGIPVLFADSPSLGAVVTLRILTRFRARCASPRGTP